MSRLLKVASLFGALLSLTACGSSGEEEVMRWIADERNLARPQVEPIPAPKQFKPESYNIGALTEPFSSQKLVQAIKNDAKGEGNSELIAKERTRRKEPLESYPLDAMSMVGSLVKAGQPMVLVKVDNLLYQVKLGNHLGQNYGLVTKISETEVTLREIVQDAAGEWIERIATLQLQEGSK
jgi:type IV pilus assembly protein PilP